MKVLFLPMYDDVLHHYGSNPYESIDWLLRYDSHLLMEPGELADYAQGHKLLTNSEATITIMEPDNSVRIPYGESAFLFFEPTISMGMVQFIDSGGNTNNIRRIRVISVKE